MSEPAYQPGDWVVTTGAQGFSALVEAGMIGSVLGAAYYGAEDVRVRFCKDWPDGVRMAPCEIRPATPDEIALHCMSGGP